MRDVEVLERDDRDRGTVIEYVVDARVNPFDTGCARSTTIAGAVMRRALADLKAHLER